MNKKEIFRYSTSTTDFIAFAEDISEDFISQETWSMPKGFESEPLYWLDLTKTSRCAKKNKALYKKDPQEAAYRMGLEEDGIQIAYEIRKQFRRWLEKEKPTFLCIGAYTDDNLKRFRVYHYFLTKENYKLYYIDDCRTYTEDVYIYARADANLKFKNLVPPFLKD